MHRLLLILELAEMTARSNDDNGGQHKLQEHRCCRGSKGLSACKEGAKREDSLSCDFTEHP